MASAAGHGDRLSSNYYVKVNRAPSAFAMDEPIVGKTALGVDSGHVAVDCSSITFRIARRSIAGHRAFDRGQ